MCGILGAIPPVETPQAELALSNLEHRGPDGKAIWRDGDKALLGHTRLAILDPSEAGSQPMLRHNRYAITFNGEIYNFVEIRNQLEAEGVSFRGDSDTEVLLAAYIRWGYHCLSRLNGMWAFAIWDIHRQELFLARDRMGEKPLYFSNDQKNFFFASEQKALLPLLDEVAPSPNFNKLIDNPYLYEGTSECLFKGIKRFPAGHFGLLKNGTLTISRYWAPEIDATLSTLPYESHVEILRELLIDSCRLRVRSDVPIGTGLSGGVDSSSIAGSVKHAFERPNHRKAQLNWQNAFTASFPGTVMDEAAAARDVAEHLNVQLNEIVIDPSKGVEEIEKATFFLEDVHEVNPLPHFRLYKAMRQAGVLVSLDGHGGDELFCGYESSILHALPDTVFSQSHFRDVLNTYRLCHPDSKQFKRLSNVQIAAYLARSAIRSRLTSLGREKSDKNLSSRSDYLNRHLYTLCFETVLPTLLRNYDRYSMMSGVEIRMPLLDFRIVNFAFSIGWRSKISNGFTKSVLRDAAAPLVPDGILHNHKKFGFAPPIVDWLRGPLKEYILDEIHSDSFQNSRLIDPSSIRAEFRALIEEDKPARFYSTEKLWKKLSAYFWEKAFFTNAVWQKAGPYPTKANLNLRA